MAKPTYRPNNFNLEAFNDRRGEALLHMSHFFLGYLTQIYQAFDGDLVRCIVLGEISHHNTARFFSKHSIDPAALKNIHAAPEKWEEMDGCNAYSLSLATGIPRETIRRKVSELKALGWITNDKKTGLRITPKCATHFAPDFSLKVLDQMLGVAGILRDLLGSAISEQPALTKTHTAETTSLPKSVKGSKNIKRAPQSSSS